MDVGLNRPARRRTPRVVVASAGKFHAYHLARAAQAAGCLERFVTTVFDAAEPDIPRERVVELRWPAYAARAIAKMPGNRSQAWSYYVGDNWFDRRAAAYAADADIYHAFNHQALHGLRAARRAGAVSIVERASAHPDVQHALLQDEFARVGLPSPTADSRLRDKHLREYDEADVIVVPSSFVYRSMVDRGVPATKLRQIPLGVSVDAFSPGTKRDGVFRVVFAGALSLQKGLPYLLEAFRLAALPPATSELVLIGDAFPEARAFLPDYRGTYRHVPFVPHAQLLQEYRQASVFVLPSLQDGFGMVVYEAAACGLPVIVSDHVGAEIRDGRDGFVVPVRNAAAIAERLVYLHTHEHERRALGASARELALRFTWQRYGRAIADLYEDVWQDRA